MGQDLMTLDFWQDTVIYEGKTLPTGTLACEALNVSSDTISQMQEHCDKLNLLLGTLNAAQDASALFPMAREAALAMLDILAATPSFSYMDIPRHREQIKASFTAENTKRYVEFAIKVLTQPMELEETLEYKDAIMLGTVRPAARCCKVYSWHLSGGCAAGAGRGRSHRHLYPR